MAVVDLIFSISTIHLEFKANVKKSKTVVDVRHLGLELEPLYLKYENAKVQESC